MTQPEPERYHVDFYVGLLDRHAAGDPLPFAFAQISEITGALYLTEAERLRRIVNLIAAVDVLLRINRKGPVCAHEVGGGSFLRRRCDVAIEWDGRVWRHVGVRLDHEAAPPHGVTPPAPVACSPECQARPEEWPCLDDCPAQIAARY